ncbi:MAG: oxygenase MpaB family protein, partial [Actinomycetota bacterium]
RKYSATDPHLLKWVHVAEIDSFLWTYQKFSKAPLDQAGRDGYVKDAAFVARQSWGRRSARNRSRDEGGHPELSARAKKHA